MKKNLTLFAFTLCTVFCFGQNFAFPLTGNAINSQLSILIAADGVTMITSLRSLGCTPTGGNFRYSTDHLSTGAIYRNTTYAATGCVGSKEIIKMDFTSVIAKPLGMRFSIMDVDNQSDSASVEIYSAGNRVNYTYFLYNPTFVSGNGASPSFGFKGSANNNSGQNDNRGSIDITTVDPFVSVDSILVHKHNIRESSGNPSLSIAKLSWNQHMVLPVKIKSISAVFRNEKIHCNWSASEEQNVSNYQIEYSTDGTRFYKTGAAISAKNTSSSLQQYESLINNPAQHNTIFLRLLITDFDGKKSYSKLLKLSGEKSLNFSVFPTSFSENIQLSYNTESSSSVDFLLIGIEGKVHFRKKIFIEKGSNSLQLSLPGNLPSGLYTLKAVSENGESFIRRLVKN